MNVRTNDTRPSPEQVERGLAALFPFVNRWQLSLNPEDMREMAYAVLLHGHGTLPLDEIHVAVNAQLDEFAQAMSRRYGDDGDGT